MNMTPRKVAIVGAARTPIGKFRSAYAKVSAITLGQVASREAMSRAGVKPEQIEDTLFGSVIQAGLGQNPARQVALGVGVPENREAVTVNIVCGSGMKAVMFGASEIIAGTYSLILAGGMESMTMAPYLLPRARDGLKYGDATIVDAILNDSLVDAYGHVPMGITGEDVARRNGITRQDADKFSYYSNMKAVNAIKTGRFKEEIVPVSAKFTGSKDRKDVADDEGPRADTTIEKLATLKPAFDPKGVLTAGNSSQLSDGGAALVLASEEKVAQLGLKPIAWIHSYHASGIAPSRVMEAPIPTVKEHLAKVNLRIEDIDLVEHNEAFSTASIAVQKNCNIPDEKFNVNGGAVALGHPVGCSGARILVTLLYEMKRRNSKLGLATLCMGGGNGLSTIVERAA
jgi:acetyl-CoA C-acetyltransferase